MEGLFLGEMFKLIFIRLNYPSKPEIVTAKIALKKLKKQPAVKKETGLLRF